MAGFDGTLGFLSVVLGRKPVWGREEATSSAPASRVGGRMMTREGSSPARAETPFARVAPGACAYSLARRDAPKLSTYDFMPTISIQGGSPMMPGTGAFRMFVISGGSPKGPSMALSIIALIRPYST